MDTRRLHICTIDLEVHYLVSDDVEARRPPILMGAARTRRWPPVEWGWNGLAGLDKAQDYSEKERAASRSGARYRRLRRSMSANAGTSPGR
jgi:hypothetical protein